MPDKGLCLREALAVCTPLELVTDTEAWRPSGHGVPKSQAPVTSPTLPQPAPSRARTLEAGERWASLAQARAASRPGLGAIAPGRRAGAPPLCPFGPRSQASLQKAQGPGVCKLPKPPASRALCQAKRAPRAAFPSSCLAAQTKRWAPGQNTSRISASPGGTVLHPEAPAPDGPQRLTAVISHCTRRAVREPAACSCHHLSQQAFEDVPCRPQIGRAHV